MYFVGTSIFLIILNNYIKNNYTEQYNNFLYDLSYKLIYIYSKCQIYINKFLFKIPYFFTNSKENISHFEFILDGKVIHKADFKTIINCDKSLLPDKYDFIIYSDHEKSNINNESCINKKILKNIPCKKEDLNYEDSKIKFISCEIEINNKKYTLSFKNDKSNYYVKNNIFDINFLKYFLLKYYSQMLNKDDIENIHNFKIHIIDHNVNFDFSDSKNLIKLDVDNYIKIETINTN